MALTPRTSARPVPDGQAQRLRPRRGRRLQVERGDGARGSAAAGHGDGGPGPCRGRQGAGAASGPSLRSRATMAPVDAAAGTGARAVAEAETISRTLLLAQRTADTTIADANVRAEDPRVATPRSPRATLDSREMRPRLEEARTEAGEAGGERLAAESEVQSLLARRDFLAVRRRSPRAVPRRPA